MNALYCRVSTDLQAETGYSIGDQIRTCREHALELGLETFRNFEYIDDGYSGEYLERPALDRLREDLRAKLIQDVIIYDPDRLSRNLTNQLLLADEIEKAGAVLHFVTGSYDASPEGRLFFSIRGAISAFEKAKIRERTLRGKRAKAWNGKIIQNGHAYGYDWDEENSTYIINQKEAAIVKMIYDLYLSRKHTIKDIALFLKQQNIFNRKNNPFTLSMIYRILTDEKYAGIKWSFNIYDKKISQYKRKKIARPQEEWIPIPIPPIITSDEYQTVRQILSENRRKSPRNTKQQYLLRNFIKCAVCGYGISAHHKLYSSGKEYSWYKCHSGGTDKSLTPCGNPAVSALELDDLIWKHLCRLTYSQKEPASILRQETVLDDTAQLTKLKDYHNQLKKKQTTIVRWFHDNMLSPDDAEKELQFLKRELQITFSSISKLSSKITKGPTTTPEEILSATSFAERRTIFENLGWKVLVDNRQKPVRIRFKI
ncbi:recombinase family protein [Pelosinus sp. UFO1]|uniref:recombinase family protein n=1 Tax=Pelosinus sp. UFO1 TaxID=484770 RepID=UPI0004D16446|nr:recombinase family protein [Pelosinus sp. UFO1]AIF52078.1 Resolvase domain-containing protein [Pelosinus sp. UFO1]